MDRTAFSSPLARIPARTFAFLALSAALASARLPAAMFGEGGTSARVQEGGLVRVGDSAFPVERAPRLARELVVSTWEAGRFRPGVFLIHFRAPTTAEDRDWMDALTGAPRRADGTRLARAYLPGDAWLVEVADAATWRELEASERLDRVVRYQPALKLDATLTEAVLTGDASVRDWTVDLVPGFASEVVATELAACGARVVERVFHRGAGPHDVDWLVVRAAARDWRELARVEGVRTVREREAAVAADLWSARACTGELTCEAAGQRPPRTAYDELAALLDLLAFDDPRLVVRAPGVGPETTALEPAVKNTLALRSSRLRPAAEPDAGVAPSAAMRRATRIEAEALADRGPTDFTIVPASRTTVAHDVARAQGFRGPEDRPHVRRVQVTADPGETLDVVLAWTDEPGALGSLGSASNDLDLVLWSPDGRGYRGNRFDETGASRPGAAPDARLTAERVSIPDPRPGEWTVAVSARRGAFSLPQGYALRMSGPGLSEDSSQKRLVPLTATLEVSGAVHSKDGVLATGDLARLRTSDDDRYALRDRESVTLAFANTLPPEAIVQDVRIRVEHHEQPRIVAGDVLWRVGHGTLANPDLTGSTTAPLREGPAAEMLDVWGPGDAVGSLGDLVLVVDNGSTSDDTLLDHVSIEVDYALPDPVPTIVSMPRPDAIVGQPYAYDADGRAEADGVGPFTWSLVSGPTGFGIDAQGLVTWTPQASGTFAVVIRVVTPGGSQDQAFSVGVGSAPFPSTLLPAQPANQTYCPPERLALGGPKGQQRLNVFLPPGHPPRNGWPVLLNNRVGGGAASNALTLLEDTGSTAPLHAFCADGVAVVDFGVTGIGNGKGLFYPPGHPSGRYESFAPGDDNPEKDAEWALQWVKTQTLFPLDTRKICLRGSSQGAIIDMWAAMGPDRARPSGSAQVRASTRVKAVLGLQPPTSVWAFDQSPALPTNMHAHYERESQPGVPATAFGQVSESFQKVSSVMGFAFDSVFARANNASQPVCLLYAEPVSMSGGQPADLTLGPDGYPNLHDTLTSPYIHDSWSGYTLYERLLGLSEGAAAFHGQHSTFAIRQGSALPPPNDVHTQTFQSNVFGPPATAIAHAWVLRELNVTGETSPKIRPAR